MNCKFCGGENDKQNKFCTYCGKEINLKGKDYSNGGNAFLVTDIFKIANKSMIIGKPLQYINVGDTLYLGDKGFKVWNMQKGKLVVDHAVPTDIQIGIIFEDYKMENIKKGATLVFREEEQQ